MCVVKCHLVISVTGINGMVSHLTRGAECAVAAVEGADHPGARRARLGGGQRPLVDVVDVADHVSKLRRDELAGRVRARE